MLLNEKCQKILRALKRDAGFIDDHDEEFHPLVDDKYRYPLVVVKYYRIGRPEEDELCPVYNCRGCSVNPFYMGEDGKVHLSMWSIGDVVYNGNIDKYNKDQEEYEWSDRLEVIYDPEDDKNGIKKAV